MNTLIVIAIAVPWTILVALFVWWEKKPAPMRIVIKRSKKNPRKWYFNVVAPNNEEVATSKMYPSIPAAEATAVSLCARGVGKVEIEK